MVCISLYTLYTAPLADIIRKHGLLYHLYSDDCQIYVSFKSSPDEVSVAPAKLEDWASEIYAWMACYKLKLNREEFLSNCSVLRYLSVTIVTLYPVRHDRYMIVKVHSYVKVVLLIPSTVL